MTSFQHGSKVTKQVWSMLETFMAMIRASLMCVRPLLVRLLIPPLPSQQSERKQANRQSKLGLSEEFKSAKQATNWVELHSENDEARGGQGNVIRVQKTSVRSTYRCSRKLRGNFTWLIKHALAAGARSITNSATRGSVTTTEQVGCS